MCFSTSTWTTICASLVSKPAVRIARATIQIRYPLALRARGLRERCYTSHVSLARPERSPYGGSPPLRWRSPMRSVSALLLTSVIALGACGGYSSAPASNTQPVATRITIYTGDGQTGPKGSMLADPLCTNVFDASGRLMYGVTVTYTVATGGGQLQLPTSVATDSRGIATSGTWTLGPAAGTQTVTASTAGVAASVTFTATAQ